jgi:hypothetical protein
LEIISPEIFEPRMLSELEVGDVYIPLAHLTIRKVTMADKLMRAITTNTADMESSGCMFKYRKMLLSNDVSKITFVGSSIRIRSVP